jgi:hypothetical protein
MRPNGRGRRIGLAWVIVAVIIVAAVLLVMILASWKQNPL